VRAEARHHAANHAGASHAAASHAVARATPARASTVRASTVRASAVCRHGRRRCAVSREDALAPEHRTPKATLRTVSLKHVRFELPPPMLGSHESLVRQNVRADQDGLTRIEDDADLANMLRTQQLVSLPVSEDLRVDPRLPANRRYCRKWTATFLADMARAHYGRFSSPLQVNSAVRTVQYQRHLQSINGNAAPAEGDIASPHLTGATIDIAKKGLSTSEIGWMRAYLIPLQSTGRIDVEEEFQQACFHITVYKSYFPEPQPRNEARAAGAMLATHVR